MAGRGNPGTSQPAGTPLGDDALTARLAQTRELEAKLTEERRQVRQLYATLEARPSTRGGRVRDVGHLARTRIENDADVNEP